MANQAKGGKCGRNAVRCKAYRLSNQREKNKAKRIIKHLQNHQFDRCAESALARVVHFLPKHERPLAA